MDYEEEINKILESITHEEYVPLNVIKETREYVINKFYDKFMKYDKNIENLKYSLDILDNYEYVEDISSLKPKDKIRYLSKKHFYDIKVSPHVTYVCNKNNYITLANGVYYSTVKDNVLFFKYIPDSTLVKMKLMELIQD
tara:strand:- start:181 stop:600 length:420 start_codon:yes stop_codon:yes gene_type:complete